MNWRTIPCDDSPSAWLGDAEGVDLRGCALQALVQGMTRSCQGEREKAVALFGHVSEMRFVVSDLDTRCDPVLLSHPGEGDGFFKGTLMLHLLRLAGVPTRLRWLQLDSSLLTRGLWDFVRLAGQPFVFPVVEARIDGHWVATDAYTMDPPLLAAVHDTLERRGWNSGFLAHRAGTCSWDGRGDAMQRFDLADPQGIQLQDLGCAHSLADFMRRHPYRFHITPPVRLAFVSQAEHFNHELGRLRLSG